MPLLALSPDSANRWPNRTSGSRDHHQILRVERFLVHTLGIRLQRKTFDARAGSRAWLRFLALACILFVAPVAARAQGGPPYFTNDPGTPGNHNWEINVGYIPFLLSDRSVSHVPDLDINFGVGKRIQLTYENAWLRVQDPNSPAKYGLGQSNAGVKWRFYDAGDKLQISTFPQVFVNNPNDAVKRGITPDANSFLLPFEFAKKFGPIGLDYEAGYQFVHNGADGWIMGLVAGHDFSERFEVDAEFYSVGTFHPSFSQPTLDAGARYKIRSPIVLLLMAGRGVNHASSDQPYFVGYFGVQFLLPPRASPQDQPSPTSTPRP